jgi:hypothetical protein
MVILLEKLVNSCDDGEEDADDDDKGFIEMHT